MHPETRAEEVIHDDVSLEFETSTYGVAKQAPPLFWTGVKMRRRQINRKILKTRQRKSRMIWRLGWRMK